MRARSIFAAIQGRDKSGDHLLDASRQMTVAEVNVVAEFHDLFQKVRSRAKALQDFGNAVSSRIGLLPDVIHIGNRPAGIVVLDPRNPWHGRLHLLESCITSAQATLFETIHQGHHRKG